MATYRKKNKPTLTRTVQLLEGGCFDVILATPNTGDILAMTAVSTRLNRALGKNVERQIDPQAYTEVVSELVEHVESVSGLEDEDGKPIVWSELAHVERRELLLDVQMNDIAELVGALIVYGQPKPDEKKSSSPTSTTSTPEAPADAPPAPQEGA